MRRLISIILFIFALIIASCGKSYKKNSDLQEFNLKGKIKSIVTIYYEGIDSMGTIMKGELRNKQTATFNIDGNVTSRRWFFGYDLIQVDTFIYDKNNRKVEFRCSGPDLVTTHRSDFIYDRKGRIREQQLFTSKGPDYNRFYEYNMDGLLSVIKGVKDDDTSFSKVSYIYDLYGNVLEESEYYHNSLFINTKSSFTTNNILTTREQIFTDNKSIFSEYNENGDERERTETNYIDSSEIHSTYEYEYDGQKNWTKRISSANDVSNTWICERIIEYY